MKTLKPFLYSLVVFAIVLSACKKKCSKIGDDENPTIQLRSMEDLVIPENFDWRMTMNSTNTLKALGDTVMYPVEGYSTLAFEDLWPSKGDYDFNDLVVEYRFKTEYGDKAGVDTLTKIVGTFIFRAAGAGTANGFGFELTGIPPSIFEKTIVSGASSITGGGSYVSSTYGWEDGQTSAVVIVAEDVTDILPLWANTSSYGAVRIPPEIVTITITPKPGKAIKLSKFEITEDNFNPFMIIDYNNSGRGREVHLRNKPPTDEADLSLFGTEDDYSSTTFGTSTYRTIGNFPWVLEIPSDVKSPTVDNSVFHYPIEKADINWTYLHFDEWAESAGTAFNGKLGTTAWWLGTNANFRVKANIWVL